MITTKIINGSGWHSPPPVKPKPQPKPKPMSSPKPPRPPRVPKKKVSKLDEKFEAWAKRNGIDLKELKLMEKNK